MAWVQRLGQLRSPVSTYANLPVTGNVLGDVRLTTDTGDAYTWMIEATSGSLSDWKKVTTSSFNDLVDAPTNSGLAIDDAVAVVTGLAINIGLLAFQTLTGYGASMARMFDSVVARLKASDGMDDPSAIDDGASENYWQEYEYVLPYKNDLDIYTKFLLHGDGIQGSASFMDLFRQEVISYGAITDTTIKKFGTGSIKFDGVNDYVNITPNAIENFGGLAAESCIDFWYYSNVSGEQPIFWNNDDGYFTIKKTAANKIYVSAATVVETEEGGQVLTSYVTSASSISNSVWTHIAAQKNSEGKLEIWINGVLDATGDIIQIGSQIFGYSGYLVLGHDSSLYLNGYIDEIRMSNCVRYTTTFTPMARAYNQSVTPAPTPTIEDESSSAHTVVVNGNARMSGTNPLFGNASLYLDGIDSYLEVSDSDPYTKLLLHLDNNVIDSSSSAKTVTNNNVVFTNVLKKFGTYSASFFENLGSYLSVADSDDFDFGSGDFTIDLWYNSRYGKDGGAGQVFYAQTPDANLTNNNVIKFNYNANNSGLAFQVKSSGTNIALYYLENASWEPTPGIWYHLALVRNGSNVYMFVNGQSMALNVVVPISTTTIPNFSAPVTFGIAQNYLPAQFSGYMDEIRVSKGIARWTSNFTPPTRPYNQDFVLSMLGEAEYGSELISNGNFDSDLTGWSIVNPYGYQVLDANGYSGNCLKLYRDAGSNDGTYAWASSSPMSVTIGQKYEISFWYNKVSSNEVHLGLGDSFGSNNLYYSPAHFNGGWTKVTYLYTATSSTLYVNFVVDNGGLPYGSHTLIDSVSVKSYASALNDYTIDLWIDPLSLNDEDAYIIGVDDSWKLTLDGTSNKYLKFSIVGGSSLIAPIDLNLETWQHVAIVQKDGTIKLYVDGILGASVAGSATPITSTNLTIGADSDGEHPFDGFIEEVRISDNARWSATFSTPDEAYDSDSNTTLLLPLNVQVVPNMVLQSVGYVSNYVPTSARVVIFEEDIDVMEQNVDLKIEVSRDGGTTFTTCLIAKDQEFGDGTLNLFSGSVDLQSQPNGELMVWKLTTQNNKDCRIRGVSLSWR